MAVWNIGETYNTDFISDGRQNDTVTVLSVSEVNPNNGCDVETKEVGSCFAKGGFKVQTRETYAGHTSKYDWFMCPFHFAFFETLPVPNVMDTLFPDAE